MDHLDPQQRATLRERLEQERERLLARQVSEDDQASPAVDPGDAQDGASQEERRTTAMRHRRHHDARLSEVDEALRRMDAGIYGICDETGEAIPYARLLAEPTTRYTVEALELIEDERARDDAIVRAPDETDAY